MKWLLFTLIWASTQLLAVGCNESCNVCDRFCEDYDPYACVHFCCTSPLVIDLDHNGFQFEQASAEGVWFDMSGNGTPERMRWVAAGYQDAFLAYDIDGDGQISSGRELFGQGTLMWNLGTTAINGFVALEQYDQPILGGNDDGYVSHHDAIWPDLLLWVDLNADAVSQPEELQPLSQSRIDRLDTLPRFAVETDSVGNRFLGWAWVSSAPPKRQHLKMVDIAFAKL